MSTLSNVETRRGESTPPSIRFTPDAFPEAKSSQTGVSVRYAPDPDKRWYVFRVSYRREDKASDYLVEDGIYTYIAKKIVEKYVGGKRKRYLQTLIPNLLICCLYSHPNATLREVNKSGSLTVLLPVLREEWHVWQVSREW